MKRQKLGAPSSGELWRLREKLRRNESLTLPEQRWLAWPVAQRRKSDKRKECGY